jgi:catechol 2,3-dioxygenase-like lactoylglutathione lyase family enzyme
MLPDRPPYTSRMVRQIVPLFFTTDIPGTLAYYQQKLGFECVGTWQDPPIYAIVARDRHAIHFRCAEPPTPNPDKYLDELLDAYIYVDDTDALYAEYAAKGVEFTRELANMPWNSREFVINDCDGRLLAFGTYSGVRSSGDSANNSLRIPVASGCAQICGMRIRLESFSISAV